MPKTKTTKTKTTKTKTAKTAARKSGSNLADLEKRLSALERRVAILEARQPKPALPVLPGTAITESVPDVGFYDEGA